jgi:hypothetical protein
MACHHNHSNPACVDLIVAHALYRYGSSFDTVTDTVTQCPSLCKIFKKIPIRVPTESCHSS